MNTDGARLNWALYTGSAYHYTEYMSTPRVRDMVARLQALHTQLPAHHSKRHIAPHTARSGHTLAHTLSATCFYGSNLVLVSTALAKEAPCWHESLRHGLIMAPTVPHSST